LFRDEKDEIHCARIGKGERSKYAAIPLEL
jgi:hypothetical protein